MPADIQERIKGSRRPKEGMLQVEVAAKLHISQGAVQTLLAEGKLRRLGDNSIDPASLEELDETVSGSTYQFYRTEKEKWSSLIAGVNYDVKLESLIDRKDVEDAVFGSFRVVAAGFRSLPDRIFSQCYNAETERAGYLLLQQATQQICESLAKEIQQYAIEEGGNGQEDSSTGDRP